MRTVAIVGAGPAGLVAAKTLLRYQKGDAFRVTVFEKDHRLGGIWALDEDSTTESFLSAHTPTNLSRYTVAFSDLSWQSVDLTSRKKTQVNGHSQQNGHVKDAGDYVPLFPKAWQAARYLETYAAKFIPGGVIKYNHAVVSTERVEVDNRARWKITTNDTSSNAGSYRASGTSTFDHLVVASGFFSQPRTLPRELSPSHDPFGSAVKILHSSQYRCLEDLFPDGVDYRGKKILLAGGGNSAGEVAGTLAFHVSSALHSFPITDRFENCKIYHISPRPLYGMPAFVPARADKTSFVPIDLRLYDLAARPAGEIPSKSGKIDKDFIPVNHGAIQSMVGGDQSDLGAEAVTVTKADQSKTPYVALSESYSEYVRSGDIRPLLGRLVRLEARKAPGGASEPRTLTAVMRQKDQDIKIEDVAAVIHATGYTPSTALDYLPDDVKQALEYDPSAFRLPLLLDQQQTMSKAVPDLAFVGFYEGPYWGIMEMQSRLIAQHWSGALESVERPFEALGKMRDLRKGMKSRDQDVPQYWLGDYLGYMEELARDLHLRRNDQKFESREGTVTPSRYLAEDDDDDEAAKTMTDLYRTLTAPSDGAFVARAFFRAMQGRWQIHRRLESAIASFPSGVLEGTAFFHPRLPSTRATDDPYDFEYMYIENGTFMTNTGTTLSATRRYVYRYREAEDRISVWFVKDDGLTVDYLFHQLKMSEEPPTKLGGHAAVAEHLCIKDMYTTRYDFSLRGISLLDWKLSHRVKGPSKDYTSTTEFER